MNEILSSLKENWTLCAFTFLLVMGNLMIAKGMNSVHQNTPTRGSMLLSSTDLISYYSEVSPSMRDANDPVWDHVQSLSGSTRLHAPTGATSLYLSSIYTDTDVYIRCSWKDIVKNDEGVYWIYHDGNWTFNSPYQDGLSIIFANNDPEKKFSQDGCMRTCHVRDSEYLPIENQLRKYSHTSLETMDMWFWSSSLTDPYHYAIDGYINSIPSDNNVGYYLDPDEDIGLVKNRPLVDYLEYPYLAQPVFMQNPDIKPRFGDKLIKSGEEVPFDDNYYDPDLGMSRINPITHQPWKNGDTVAGYLLDRLPSGGDVAAVSYYSHTNQEWTVVFRRSLTTDDEINDIQFEDLTEPYLFGISIFGDLQGTFYIKPDNSSGDDKTRCVPDKVTDTIKLRFQPIYLARHAGSSEPLFNGFHATNSTNATWTSAIMEDPIWSTTQMYRENLYDLNNEKMASQNSIWDFDLRAIYSHDSIYLKINWTGSYSRDDPRLEIGWQSLDPISMYSKNYQFLMKDGHMNTNSPLGGDLWIIPLGKTNSIGSGSDFIMTPNGSFEDETDDRNDITFCYTNSDVVIKRSLTTDDPDDVQFRDLTRVYMLSVLFYGIGYEDYMLTHLLSVRFEPDFDDKIKPSRITGLKFVDGKDSNAILTWDPAAEHDFGCYQIYYSQKQFTVVTGMMPLTKISDVDLTTFEMNGLKPDEEHYFAVTTLDNNRNEDKSVLSIKCDPTDIMPPPRIEGLKAVSGDDSDVFLEWDPSASVDFMAYRIYVSEIGQDSIFSHDHITEITDRKTVSYRVEGLKSGIEYNFAVTAIDHVGNEDTSVIIASAKVKDITPPGRISGLYAYDKADFYGGGLGVTWNPSPSKDILCYKIYMSTETFDNVDGMEPLAILESNYYDITGLQDLKKYYFVVTVEDWNGHVSPPSICVSATPTRSGPPEPVEMISGVDSKDGKVTLTWSMSNSSYFNHYCLYISKSPIINLSSPEVSRLANLTSRDKTMYNVSGLEDGVTYYFAITVANIHNAEERTVIISTQAMPTATPPPPRNILREILPYIVFVMLTILAAVGIFVMIGRVQKYGSLRTRRFERKW